MKKIFITGGAGFIGSHLSRVLYGREYRVTVFDNFSASNHEKFVAKFSGYIEIIRGDITDRHLLGLSLDKTRPDAVVHLAASVSVQDSIENPGHTRRVNIEGTRNVVQASVEAGVKKFIFASSAAVYGNQPSPVSEDNARWQDPDYRRSLPSPYASSKLEGEQLVMASGLEAVVFRMFNVYGPGQGRVGSYAAVIPEFIERMEKNQNLEIYGDGGQTRDFVYVDDVTGMFAAALEARAQGVYNLASGRATSLLDLVAAIERVYSRKADIRFLPGRNGDIRHSCADITKIKNELGFEPRVDLEAGIKTCLP